MKVLVLGGRSEVKTFGPFCFRSACKSGLSAAAIIGGVTDASPSAFRQGANLAWAWAWRWTMVGVVLGLIVMFSRAVPMAESGGRPDSLLSYALWVPALGALGLIAGMATGVVFAILASTVARWDGMKMLDAAARSMLCGAAAGAIVGLPTLPGSSMGPAVGALMVFTTLTGWLMRHRVGALAS